jgi:hypothetical protein
MENALNTISRRSFLAELYKNPDLHPIFPLVEMIYSRDSTVHYFDPNDASLFTTRSSLVRQGDPLGPVLFNLAISTPLRNIRERCKDSSAIQIFSNYGTYLIKTPFVPTVLAVATEKFGKVGSRVQPIKYSFMVPPDTAPELLEVIRAKIPVVTGTSNLGTPLATDFSMSYGPPPSHSEGYVYSKLQDSVEVDKVLLDNIVCFPMSDFEEPHVAFRLMFTCAARRYGLLLRTLPLDICRPYLVVGDRAVRAAVFRIFGVSKDAQTFDKLNCAKRQLSLPAKFGGLNMPSLELDNDLAHYSSFSTTLANLIIEYESESLGPMYDLIRQEVINVAPSTLPWAVQLRSSYDLHYGMVFGIGSRDVD